MKEYISEGSWRKVADLPKYKGRIDHMSLYRYAHGKNVINVDHRMIFGLDVYVPAPACPICHEAPTVCLCDGHELYDPATQRTTAKPGTGKRSRATRALSYEISAGTPMEDIVSKLAALGHHVRPVEGEIEL